MGTAVPPDLLLCPRCRSHSSNVSLAAGDGAFRCPSCAATYPVRDGVIDLLPEVPARRTAAQAAMESGAIVRIYESRLWRRSFIATLAFGISFEHERQLVLQASSPPQNGAVLDLACGPGIYSRPLARLASAGTVVGLDLSLPMLRYARRRARAAGIENLVFVRASAMEMPLPDGRFDAVNCCGALHLFPHPAVALGEVRRVLKAGGTFTAAVFRRSEGRLSPASHSFSERIIGVRGFSEDGMQRLLQEAGFEAPRRLHASARWLIVAARNAAHSPARGEGF